MHKNQMIQKHLEKHPEDAELSIEGICLAAGGQKLANEVMGERELNWIEHPTVQVIVNKNREVYPVLNGVDEHILAETLSDYFFYTEDWQTK